MAVDTTLAESGWRILIEMARSEGLPFFEQMQVRENEFPQLEIWPPFHRAFIVAVSADPRCSYKTHLMRMIVLHDLRFIFEVVGQVHHVGSFFTDNRIDENQMRSELGKLMTATVCKGRRPIEVYEGPNVTEVMRQGMADGNYSTAADYRYRSAGCELLVDQPGQTRCSSCLQSLED